MVPVLVCEFVCVCVHTLMLVCVGACVYVMVISGQVQSLCFHKILAGAYFSNYSTLMSECLVIDLVCLPMEHGLMDN